MDKLSSPVAILIGSMIISISILVSSGTLNIKGLRTAGVTTDTGTKNIATTPAPNQTAEDQQPKVTLNQVKSAFTKSKIKFGKGDEKLIVVEASDPSCPFCHIAAGKNPELNKEVGSRFTLVSDGGTYVAPVPEIRKLVEGKKAAFAMLYYNGHSSGEMGAKALYCAYDLGKFWEAHDLLMSSKGYDLINSSVKNDKSKSGLLAEFLQPAVDPVALKTCLESGKYDDRLQEDMSLAAQLGVGGTPGFFLNDKMFNGAYSYKDMETVVEAALK